MSHNSRHNNSLKPTGRKELLLWLNSLCSSTYPFVEALRDGAAYCSVVEAAVRRVASNTMTAAEKSAESRRASKCAHKAASLLRQVKWDATPATCETANASKDPLAIRNACEHNFNLLVEMIAECVPHEFALTVDIDRLAQGKLQDHLAVLQWLYDFMSRLLVQYSVEAIAARLAAHEPKKQPDTPTRGHDRSTLSTHSRSNDSSGSHEGDDDDAVDVDGDSYPQRKEVDSKSRRRHQRHTAAGSNEEEYDGNRTGHLRRRGNSRNIDSSGGDEIANTPEIERSYSNKSWGRQSYDKSSKHVSFVGDSFVEGDAHGESVEPRPVAGSAAVSKPKSSSSSSSSSKNRPREHGDNRDPDSYADPSLLTLRNEVEAFEAIVLDAQHVHQSHLSPAADNDGASEVTLASLGQLLDRRDALWQALDAIETATLSAATRSTSSNVSVESTNNYVYSTMDKNQEKRNQLLEELCALFGIPNEAGKATRN